MVLFNVCIENNSEGKQLSVTFYLVCLNALVTCGCTSSDATSCKLPQGTRNQETTNTLEWPQCILYPDPVSM